MTKLQIQDKELADLVRDYIRTNGTEIADDSPIAVTLPGSAKAPQRCMSGSGKMTSGGRFAPGYDAKLKSALYAIARGKPEAVPAELVENGPMYIPLGEWTPEKAIEALEAFEWPLPVPPKPKAEKKPKPEKAEGDVNSDGQPAASRRRESKKDREARLAREAEAEAEAELEDDDVDLDEDPEGEDEV